MKEIDSLKLDQWRDVNGGLILAYLDCYSKLANNQALNPVDQLYESLMLFDPTTSTKTQKFYNSAYTIARELGVFYQEEGKYFLSKLALKTLKDSIKDADFAIKNYLQTYFFNTEYLINGKVVHPLFTLLEKFNDDEFNVEDVMKIEDLCPSSVSNLNPTSFQYFLNRLVLSSILNKTDVAYQFNNSHKIKDKCSFSKLSVDEFRNKFIGDENHKNVVKLMLDRGLINDFSSIGVAPSAHSLNTIFYGPAGTGKTYISVERAVEVIDGSVDGQERSQITARFKALKDEGQISFVTFHQSFSYEEFVEGISVTTNRETKKTEYKIKDGIFKQIAETASLNPDHNFVLIIDEINRGNVSKIFGELITLLEPSKRLGNLEQLKLKLPYTQADFGVPNNLYIIGTMNSSDRSLTAFDVAMRRRFKFEELLPDTQLFEGIEIDGIKIQLLLEAINERIEYLIGRDYCIGHAYFTPLLDKDNQTFEKLADILKNQILPLLQEYFYSDWEKIDLVLGGNSFIRRTELTGKSLRLFQEKSVEPEEVWSVNARAFNDLENYIDIYKDIVSKETQP